MNEHDPFSLGDSDDDEAKKKDGSGKEGASEEERLKKAAEEAMGENIGAGTVGAKDHGGAETGTKS